MYSIAISPVKTRTFKPRLALVAATLFAALLVVALTVIAPFMRSLSTQPNNPAAANQQTPPTGISHPKAVYISVDARDIVGRSLGFALRVTDGTQLNTYDLPLSIEQLTVAGGFLYPMGYENFSGVNLATRATWHITGSQGANQGFSDLHVVNGVLYVSLSTTSTGSFILALNPATRQALWRPRAIPGTLFNSTLVQHVAYFGTDQAPPNVSGDTLGRFDAYDLGQRKLLWETTAPSVARTYAAANGTLYTFTQLASAGGAVAPKLIAFTATHGKI